MALLDLLEIFPQQLDLAKSVFEIRFDLPFQKLQVFLKRVDFFVLRGWHTALTVGNVWSVLIHFR